MADCQGPEANLVNAVAAAGRLDFVVNTLPGSTAYVLPDEMVAMLRQWRPVVLEAAYIPRQTPFVLQALECGCEIVEGVELLFEQGCAQVSLYPEVAAAAIHTRLRKDGIDLRQGCAFAVRNVDGSGSAAPSYRV